MRSTSDPSDLRDPMGLRDDAPLFDAWLTFTEHVAAGAIRPFTIPGHKQRTHLIGDLVHGDVPLYAGLDTMKQTAGLLARAEARAARWWGADWCRFSTGGSTHGNQTLALALGSPGDTVIVSRTLHRSMLLGLVLAGLVPVWVQPPIDPATGLPSAVEAAAVRDALARHPHARAVLLGDPTYVGTVADIPALADAAHSAGAALVVDAAWGAHFGAHTMLPAHPLAAGADAVVTSAHKTLPAYSAAAVVTARTTHSGGLLDADRLDRAFEATHTTSPSGAVLASIDASRALLERHGTTLCAQLIQLVGQARERLSSIPGVAVLGGDRVEATKLVVLLAGTGAHGNAVEADLIAAGHPVESADRDTIVAMVTLADDESTVAPFVTALTAAIERHRGAPRAPAVNPAWSVAPTVVLAPREAFFAPQETVDWADAAGRVSAELVAPYPPGVPVLAPGELITAGTLDALTAAHRDGDRIAYAADPTLRTVQVIRGA